MCNHLLLSERLEKHIGYRMPTCKCNLEIKYACKLSSCYTSYFS